MAPLNNLVYFSNMEAFINDSTLVFRLFLLVRLWSCRRFLFVSKETFCQDKKRQLKPFFFLLLLQPNSCVPSSLKHTREHSGCAFFGLLLPQVHSTSSLQCPLNTSTSDFDLKTKIQVLERPFFGLLLPQGLFYPTSSLQYLFGVGVSLIENIGIVFHPF